MRPAVVLDVFDNFDARDMRFLQKASELGPLHVLLLGDAMAEQLYGHAPKFPQQERQYFIEAVRYVNRVTLVDDLLENGDLPFGCNDNHAVLAIRGPQDNETIKAFCQNKGLQCRVIEEADLDRMPDGEIAEGAVAREQTAGRKRIIVTGCYDWFHSGHVRFFEEASQLGELYVVVGHDANIRMLKGDGHPMFPDTLRRYMAASIRYVHQALISSGTGWLDAEPEIERIRPDVYVVNEDGDRPEKMNYCRASGIEYRVLKRTPKDGLPRRESTTLRGF